MKQKFNTGSAASLYYWKENNGLEIDLLADTGKEIIPIEIKAASTFNESFLKNLRQWMKLSQAREGILLYDGMMEFSGKDHIQIANWRNWKVKFR